MLAFGMRYLSVLLLAAACSKSKESSGLAPAGQWKAGGEPTEAAGLPPGHPTAPSIGGAPGGMPPGHPPIGDGAAIAGSPDMAPPDPNRPIDPNRVVAGTISIATGLKDKVKPGALFVFAKAKDPSTGQGIGVPLAAEKLTFDGTPVNFVLSENNAMVEGTKFAGEVVVMARWDQDGDVMSKAPGDITGQAVATIPAKNVSVVLGTVLP